MTYSKQGVKVDASALTQPGVYNVTVRANASKDAANGKVYGGYVTFSVEVLGTTINANSDVAFTWDGVKAASATAAYDGTNQLSRLNTIVLNAKGDVMEQGKDYDLVVKKDGKGDAVTEAVNAGSYTVTVSPKTFELQGDASFKLTITPTKATQLVDQTVTYTGSDLQVPQAMYKDGDSKTAIDTSLYKVVAIKNADGKVVSTMKDAGDYTVTIALNADADGNLQLVDDDFVVTVRKAVSFDDVAADQWYAQPVEQAAGLGYIKGYAGTKLFGPTKNITRADAVCVLFNMAGGDRMDNDQFSNDGGKTFETGFKDANNAAYYAKALAWAHKTGVANGYADGSGNFGVNDQITREQFAALLSNYAKLAGDYKAPTKDLSAFKDANTVSDWAKTVVEWAVENGVMGNGGFLAGQSNVTRAEVAAMAVNYQPEALKSPLA